VDLYGEIRGGNIRQMLHSAELHVLQASTLTNDGVAKGARGRGGGRAGRAREAGGREVEEGEEGCRRRRRARQRALEQKIHPSSRDLLHPLAHRLTYNLPAKHGFNLALSRYRSAADQPPRSLVARDVFTLFLRSPSPRLASRRDEDLRIALTARTLHSVRYFSRRAKLISRMIREKGDNARVIRKRDEIPREFASV